MNDIKPHLSASQIIMFLRCPRQWAFRYIEHIKSPPSGAMKQSSVWHLAVKRNYRQKIETHKDLPLDEMTDYYAETFDEEVRRETPVLDLDQTLPGLKDEGIEITREHHRNLAPSIQPVMVEEKRTVSLGKEEFAYDLTFTMDLIDDQRNVRDNKALRRQPSQADLDKDLQMTTYSLAYRIMQKQEFGDAAQPEAGLKMDAVIKTHFPTVVTLETQRSREGLRLHLNNIGHIAKQIKAEAFPMNPNGWWCSPKFCGYWSRCMGRGVVFVDLGKKLEESIEKVESKND